MSARVPRRRCANRAACISARVGGLAGLFGWLPEPSLGIDAGRADIAPSNLGPRGTNTYLLNTTDLPSRAPARRLQY